MSHHADNEGRTCWICLDGGTDEGGRSLVRECSCRGSAGYVHTSCLIGYVQHKTKKDLSAIGQFAMFAVIGLLIASVVNVFFYSSTFHFILSILVILVFSALNAYDHQQIKEQALHEGDNEGMAIMSSVGLYLNFLNLFTAFMHLFGVRE